MTGQSWLADALAASMMLTSGYCVTRLVLSWRHHRATDHQVDFVHVLMGVAMAGMLMPGLRVLWTGGWEVVFGGAALFFAWRMIGGARARTRPGHPSGHHAQHLLACVAMVYMLAAVTSAAKVGPGGAAMGVMPGDTAHVRTLALVLAVCLLGYVVWTADQIPSLARVAALAASSAPDLALAPSGSGRVAAAPAAPAAPAALARQRHGTPLSPRLAACCEIAMGITMGYMLVVML